MLKEGEVGKGDEFQLIKPDAREVKVTDIVRLYVRDKHNFALMRRAIEVEALSPSWRDYFRSQIEKLEIGEQRSETGAQKAE